ncbi:MAG: PAS domain S-box protein, partial [Nitrospirae bacterium]
MPLTIRQRIFLLIILVTLVCSAIAGVTIVTLYRTAVESERARLMAMTHAQAQLMEAIARFDERFSAHDHPDGAAGATLSQILDAHRHHTEFGRTGELTLARRENDRIVWLLPLRHTQSGHPNSPITDRLAQPMRLALTGNSGTVIGRDYRGEMVLAAYRHVAPLGLGLVSKIDLEEIRAPFVRAGVLTGVIGLGVIALSRLLLFWIRQPIIERLEESEAYTRAILTHAADGIITADETGTIQTFNATAERIFLYPAADVIGKNLGMLMPAPDNEAHRGYIETYLKT